MFAMGLRGEGLEWWNLKNFRVWNGVKGWVKSFCKSNSTESKFHQWIFWTPTLLSGTIFPPVFRSTDTLHAKNEGRASITTLDLLDGWWKQPFCCPVGARLREPTFKLRNTRSSNYLVISKVSLLTLADLSLAVATMVSKGATGICNFLISSSSSPTPLTESPAQLFKFRL